MLLTCDGNQALADPLGCRDYITMAGQLPLGLVHLSLNFLTRLVLQRFREFFNQRPQWRIAPA
ncbi:hypothetical protein D3C77_759740 [compost metagenome]